MHKGSSSVARQRINLERRTDYKEAHTSTFQWDNEVTMTKQSEWVCVQEWMRSRDNCIVLYCIVSINLYSASCSAHQSEALPVRETQREESSLERTKRR